MASQIQNEVYKMHMLLCPSSRNRTVQTVKPRFCTSVRFKPNHCQLLIHSSYAKEHITTNIHCLLICQVLKIMLWVVSFVGMCDGFQCYMGDMCDVTCQYHQQTNNDVVGHVGCVNETKHICWSFKEVDKKQFILEWLKAPSPTRNTRTNILVTWRYLDK